LKELDETINWPYLMLQIGLISLWLVLNPGMTVRAAIPLLRKVKNRRTTALLTKS
jgi:hypothetical protein